MLHTSRNFYFEPEKEEQDDECPKMFVNNLRKSNMMLLSRKNYEYEKALGFVVLVLWSWANEGMLKCLGKYFNFALLNLLVRFF